MEVGEKLPEGAIDTIVLQLMTALLHPLQLNVQFRSLLTQQLADSHLEDSV